MARVQKWATVDHNMLPDYRCELHEMGLFGQVVDICLIYRGRTVVGQSMWYGEPVLLFDEMFPNTVHVSESISYI